MGKRLGIAFGLASAFALIAGSPSLAQSPKPAVTKQEADQFFTCVIGTDGSFTERLAACEAALVAPSLEDDQKPVLLYSRANARLAAIGEAPAMSDAEIRRLAALSLADYDAALALNPARRDMTGLIYERKATLQEMLGDSAGSKQSNDLALTFNPDNIFALLRRADEREAAAQYTDALADLDRVIAKTEKDPTYANSQAKALNSRCWIHAAYLVDKLEQARADCTASLAINDSGETYDSRGLVGLREGNFGMALADYAKAAELLPEVGSPFYGKAIAETRLGRTEDAKADMAKALTLDPDIANTYRDVYKLTP